MIGRKIKERREALGWSQKKLSELTGIKANTISNYENEVSNPDDVKMQALMTALNVDANYLFSDYIINDDKFCCSAAERSMTEKYRVLDNFGKEAVDCVLDIEYRRCTKNNISSHPLTRYLFTAPDAASAGAGYTFFDSPDWDKCRFDVTGYDPDILDECFVVRVDGDSMQPMFFDGDYVLVRPDVPLEIGDIGLFVVNNDKGYIKKKGTDRLISVNPDYDDIYPSEDDVIEGKGKVLGTVEKV